MEKVFEGNFDQNCYSLEKSPKTIFGKLPMFYKFIICCRDFMLSIKVQAKTEILKRDVLLEGPESKLSGILGSRILDLVQAKLRNFS